MSLEAYNQIEHIQAGNEKEHKLNKKNIADKKLGKERARRKSNFTGKKKHNFKSLD